MKKLIFALVFCCLAGAGYAQEFTVTNAHEVLFCYTDKKFEKQLDSSSPTFNTRVQRAGTYFTTPVQEEDTYMQQAADRLLTPEMRKMLKKLEGDHSGKYMITKIFFDKTGKAITSQIIIPKEFLDTFPEKYVKELYNRALKEAFNEKIFRFYTDAELCSVSVALSVTKKPYNREELMESFQKKIEKIKNEMNSAK